MATLQQNVDQANADFQAIKGAIVASGVEVADGTKTADYASKVTEVYEAGKQSQYDAFWDAFQVNGTRVNYERAFANGWDEKSFDPKYSMKPTAAAYMFSNNVAQVDLRELLNRRGITLDFSGIGNNIGYAFSSCKLTALPAIDLTSITAGDYRTAGIFGWTNNLHTIDKIIIKDDGSTPFNAWFDAASALVEVRFEGVIGQSGLRFSQSTKLSKASITDVMEHLSTTTSGLTVTFSTTAVNTAFETADGAADGSTSEAWLALVNSRPNWTISLS